MRKMKTPMQELIELFEDRLSSLKEVRATAFDEMKRVLDIQIEELEVCVDLAESMLEKEKEVMQDFATDYERECRINLERSIEKCWEETFNTKER